jgi:hypothetical protein
VEYVTVHWDCSNFRGKVRENRTVPFGYTEEDQKEKNAVKMGDMANMQKICKSDFLKIIFDSINWQRINTPVHFPGFIGRSSVR